MNSLRFALLASTVLPALAATAPTQAEAAVEVTDAPAIIVYGVPDGYDIEKTRTATKTETPLIDVPQTVTVLSREQLDDQGVESLNDALRYVPGVVLGQGEGHRDQITLRGQSTTADFFLDGLRDDAQYYRPLYNTDRVEVLKGANALIFGRGGGGGVINRVSKAPEFNKGRTDFAGGVDSFGAWSLAADLDRPLGDALAVRLNATYEDFANHRDFYAGHFVGIAPTLGWKLGEATRLVLGYEYADDQRLTDRGVPSFAGTPLKGYDEVFFGSLAANHSEVQAHIARARLDHDFSDALTANLAAQYAHYDKYYGNVQGNLIWTGNTGIGGPHPAAGLRSGRSVDSGGPPYRDFPRRCDSDAGRADRRPRRRFPDHAEQQEPVRRDLLVGLCSGPDRPGRPREDRRRNPL